MNRAAERVFGVFGSRKAPAELEFAVTRLGPIMSSRVDEPHDAWGVLLTYRGVSLIHGQLQYSMGIAILDAERPSRVLYRTPLPILEPETDYERNGLTSNVVFPSATDQRTNGAIDVYYGAADRVIAAARVTLPSELLSDTLR